MISLCKHRWSLYRNPFGTWERYTCVRCDESWITDRGGAYREKEGRP